MMGSEYKALPPKLGQKDEPDVRIKVSGGIAAQIMAAAVTDVREETVRMLFRTSDLGLLVEINQAVEKILTEAGL